jgi:arylsulfatase A-like enzyme/tetratricopeptide (TPR) repeat protein
MQRKIIVCGATAAALGILAIWLWPRPRVNVLLITLDTTRADRLGCYGYAGARTPVLDALAASGVLCEHAYTVAPLTLPAHTSLFTGLYPAEHGVRSNGRGRLDDSIPTMAEILRRHGYDTGAFVASFVLDSTFGLAKGFRTYDDDIVEDAATDGSHHRERDGQRVVDSALAWLAEKRAGPFFCWVHLYDPHAPYVLHEDLFGDEFVDQPYDAEIAYMDRQVGRLVDFLRGHRVASETLIVVVGDHGEGLGDHIEPKHGLTLYNTILHVPLIFSQPKRLTAGRRIGGDISLVDISPTILDLAGVPDPRTTTGKNITPRLAGSDAPHSTCYAATDEPFLYNRWSPLRSLTEGSWKYIRTTRPELYDLNHDPGELDNLADSNLTQLQIMSSHLFEFESRLTLRPRTGVQLRPDERRALKSLGYLGGTGTPNEIAPASTPLADVKDMLPYEAAIDRATELIERGDFSRASEMLREAVDKVPGYSKAHCFLATALRRETKLSEAADVLEALLEQKPDAVEGHYNLGIVRLDQGREADAMAEFQKTVDLDPDFAEAHYDLAMMFVRHGRAAEALEHFDAVLEIDHCHGAAYRERGALLVTMGRIADGVADFRQALRYSRNAPSLHHNLGVVLIGMGRGDEALTHLRRAVELGPENPDFHYSLGTLLLDRRHYDEAIEELSEAVRLRPEDAVARKRLETARDTAADAARK